MLDQQKAFFAHSAAGPDESPQLLLEHLSEVAKQCADFAMAFDAADMGMAAGMAHDIGKATQAFQDRLEGRATGVDHKSQGARLLIEKYGPLFGKLMAYAVAGHHGGLPDAFDTGSSTKETLEDILGKTSEADADYVQSLPFPTQARRTFAACGHMGNAAAFFTRMLYSCLVDADYLDTEAHFEPEKHALRGTAPPLSSLRPRFDAYMEKLRAHAAVRIQADPSLAAVCAQRDYVKGRCDQAAALPPGFFSLQVPTGGGKTLSSISFCLRHAERYGMRRIVLALPFITVTEQNAAILQQALGSDAVLEHHSSMVTRDDDSDDARADRLACENWSSPVIVTTNVQLFESLFSNKPAKCRKLHNLAGSVIVLDEAQAIPDAVLRPCLLALWLLCRDYGCSVVLCTATQPDYADVWPEAADVRPIIPDAARLFEAMQRTTISYVGALSDAELAGRLSEAHQALCIVNTRPHAAKLYGMLEKANHTFHLSARMCPVHRTEVLCDVRLLLQSGDPCVVVATNLVEAGVDIDFPTVYRAAAGIDSIVQAGGRCNREGRFATGDVIVFDPECRVMRNWLGRMAGLGREILRSYPDPSTPEAIAAFYRLRFGGGTNLDRDNVIAAFEDTARTLDFPFRQVGEDFHMIEAPYSVVIPYDENARALIAQMQGARYPAWYLSRLQPYMVSVKEKEYDALLAVERIREIGGTAVLNCQADALSAVYTKETGLVLPPDEATLIW